MSADELLTQLDANGRPLPEPVNRSEAHRKGIWHRAVSIFVVNSRGEFLIERRSSTKDLFPGLYDIPGGHVGFEQTPRDVAVRELKQELGLTVAPADLRSLTSEDAVVERVIIPELSVVNLERKTIFCVEVNEPNESDILVRAARWAQLQHADLEKLGAYGEVSHVEFWSWETLIRAVESTRVRVVASGTESSLNASTVRTQIQAMALDRRRAARQAFFSRFAHILSLEESNRPSTDDELRRAFGASRDDAGPAPLVQQIFVGGAHQPAGAYKVGAFRHRVGADPYWVKKLEDPSGRYVDNFLKALQLNCDTITLTRSTSEFVNGLLNLPLESGDRFRDSFMNLTEIAVARRAALLYLSRTTGESPTPAKTNANRISIEACLRAGEQIVSFTEPRPRTSVFEQLRELVLAGLGAASADFNNPDLQNALESSGGFGSWLLDFFQQRTPHSLAASLGGSCFLEDFYQTYVESRRPWTVTYLAGSAGQTFLTLSICRLLLKFNPSMKISLIPKGEDTGNDLSFHTLRMVMARQDSELIQDLNRYMTDARFEIVTAGPSGPGLDPGQLSRPTAQALAAADVILAEGQAYAELTGWLKPTYISFRVNGRVAEALHGVGKGSCGFVKIIPAVSHFEGFEVAVQRSRLDPESGRVIPLAKQTTSEYVRAVSSPNYHLLVSKLFRGDERAATKRILEEASRLDRTFAAIVLGPSTALTANESEARCRGSDYPVFAMGGGGGFSSVTLKALRMLSVDYAAGVPSTDDGGSTGELQSWLRSRRGFVFGVGDLAAILQDAIPNRGKQALLAYRFETEPDDLPSAVVDRIEREVLEPTYESSPLGSANDYVSFVCDQANLARVIQSTFRQKAAADTLPVKGCSIRNLNVIAALELCGCLGSTSPRDAGSAEKALHMLRSALGLGVGMTVSPVTYEECSLFVDYELPITLSEQHALSIPDEALQRSRRRLFGQRFIDHFMHPGKRLDVGVAASVADPDLQPTANQNYLDHLRNAQLVVMGAGSLIGSQLAQLAVPGVVDTLLAVHSRRILVINHVKMDETFGMSLSDHIRLVERVANRCASRDAIYQITKGARELTIADIFTDIVLPRSVAKEIETELLALESPIVPAEEWHHLSKDIAGKPLDVFRNRYIEYLLQHRDALVRLGVTRKELEILSYLEQPPRLYQFRSESGRYRGAVFAMRSDIEYLLSQGIHPRNIHEVDAIGENWKIRKAAGEPSLEFFPGLVPEALMGIFKIALEQGGPLHKDRWSLGTQVNTPGVGFSE